MDSGCEWGVRGGIVGVSWLGGVCSPWSSVVLCVLHQ